MAQVYECKMTTVITVNIRANSAEEVEDWMSKNSTEELERMESGYFDIEYDDQVIGEVDEEAAIDISY